MKWLVAAIVVLAESIVTLSAHALPMLVEAQISGGTLVGGQIGPGSPPPSVGLVCTANSGIPFTSLTNIAAINTVINTLNSIGGAVVCLQRGQTWSAAAGLNLTASFPNANRVTICAADLGGTICTDSGAANPRISITGSTGHCVDLNGNDGYTFRFLDCYGSATNDSAAWQFDAGSQNVTIEGGVVDTFMQAFQFSGAGAGAGPLTNGRIGTCAAPMEVRGTPNVPSPSHIRAAVSAGTLRDSSISLYMHDLTGFGTASQNHWIDISDYGHGAAGSGNDYNSASAAANVTIECSHFVFSGGAMGTLVDASKGMNLIFRDNVYDATGGCPDVLVGFKTHNDPPVEGWDGAEVYRNRINAGGCSVFEVIDGRNLNIYNNVANLTTANFQRGFVQFNISQGGTGFGNAVVDVQIANVAIFNNTIYRAGNTPPTGDYALISDSPGAAPDGGRTTPTNVSLVNNLFFDTETTNAEIWATAQGQTCNGYGANGAGIHDNFVYTPNDPTPSLWSGCSGALRNSNQSPHAGGYVVDPLLTSVGAGNFHPTLAGHPTCGFSAVAGPATDYEQLAFPTVTPFDVGAFRCPP